MRDQLKVVKRLNDGYDGFRILTAIEVDILDDGSLDQSDAHVPGRLGFVFDGAARAEAAGILAERIVTTWALEKLLTWVP